MSEVRSFRVHGPRGVVDRPVRELARSAPRARQRTVADTIPIVDVMSRRVVCASPDLPFDRLLALMVEERLGCVPVVDDGDRPIGMVTKLDIVEHLVEPETRAAIVSDVMMPLAITLDEHSTVGHAAALMASEDMHHVMIVAGRKLVGVVSTMDITRWLADNDGMPA